MLFGTRNDRKFKIDGGGAFYGTLHPADEGSFGVAKFFFERKLLRVRPGAKINPGAIFYADGERFLVSQHQEYRDLFVSFRVFRVTDHLSWLRPQSGVVDPVTKLPLPAADQNRGKIWVVQERIQDEELDIGSRVKQERYRILAGVGIEIGDKIGDLKVTRSDPTLGITLAEAET